MAKNSGCPKTGVSMGRIENTNTVKSIPCNCKKCCHSYKKKDILYCAQYGLIRPNKKTCKRYATRDDYSISKKEYLRLVEEKNKRKEPVFPWDRM